jgi:hypothetical protein
MTATPTDRLTEQILRDLLDTGTPFMVLFNVAAADEVEAPAVIRQDARWTTGLLLDFSGPQSFRDAALGEGRFGFRVSMTNLYGRDFTFSFRLASVLQIRGEGFAFVRLPGGDEPEAERAEEPAAPARSGLRLVRGLGGESE